MCSEFFIFAVFDEFSLKFKTRNLTLSKHFKGNCFVKNHAQKIINGNSPSRFPKFRDRFDELYNELEVVGTIFVKD